VRGIERRSTAGVAARIRCLEQVLGHGQRHHGGGHVLVAEGGRQGWEPCLRTDPGARPGPHPLHDDGMPQGMEARPNPAHRRLEARPPDDLPPPGPEGHDLIALPGVVIPPAGGRALDRRLGAGTGVERRLEPRHHRRRQREPTGLAELGLADREGGLRKGEIADGQADECAQPSPCAVGQQPGGGARERPSGHPWRGIAAGGGQQALPLVEGINVGGAPVVHRMTDHQAIELWRAHRRSMALQALRQRPAALPACEAGFRGRGLLRLRAHEDRHRQLVGVRPGVQRALERPPARLCACGATAEARPMGEMLPHGRAQVATQARPGT
jgi:hypothetical protein